LADIEVHSGAGNRSRSLHGIGGTATIGMWARCRFFVSPPAREGIAPSLQPAHLGNLCISSRTCPNFWRAGALHRSRHWLHPHRCPRFGTSLQPACSQVGLAARYFASVASMAGRSSRGPAAVREITQTAGSDSEPSVRLMASINSACFNGFGLNADSGRHALLPERR